MKHCETCTSWTKLFEVAGKQWGECNVSVCPRAVPFIALTGHDIRDLRTHDFGCVLHEERGEGE